MYYAMTRTLHVSYQVVTVMNTDLVRETSLGVVQVAVGQVAILQRVSVAANGLVRKAS